MISDPNALAIEVDADESVVDANKSVSLGLIITELVINALKHGYPGHARGRIIVDYHSDGPHWSLSVRDDGIGMPAGIRKAEAGLGTGIAEALAKHLGASIQVIAASPGVEITISHIRDQNGRRHASAA
jgi:two-component sensor histidine kinase